MRQAGIPHLARLSKAAVLSEIVRMRDGLDPTAILLIKNPDRFVWNHFARAADRTIDSPHRTCPYWFGDEFDFQRVVTCRTYALQQNVPFHLNLRSSKRRVMGLVSSSVRRMRSFHREC